MTHWNPPCGSTPIQWEDFRQRVTAQPRRRAALTPRLAYEDTSGLPFTPDVLEAGSHKKPIPAANRLQPKTFNPSSSAQAMVAMKYSCFERRIARSQNCVFVNCPSLPTLRPLADAFGARNFLRNIVATGAVPTIFQPRPWGRGAPPDPRTRSKTAHLPSACARLSRSGEKAIVEVVTPIAVGDNAFGRLSSLQRPFRNGRHRGRAKTLIRASIRIGAIAMFGLASAIPGASQDMMQHVDLASPEMASAEMTRADVEAAIASATSLKPADLAGKKLSGLDLSGLDLSGAILRGARLNKTKLRDAKLDRAILDQAWLVEADLSRARLVGALLTGANLSADMKNQSMGLMRAVLKSSNLERAILREADLSRVDLEFASLKNADLTNASLRGAALGGATLARVTVNGADFNGADLASTRLIEPIGLDAAKNFDKAQNIDRLLRE